MNAEELTTLKAMFDLLMGHMNDFEIRLTHIEELLNAPLPPLGAKATPEVQV